MRSIPRSEQVTVLKTVPGERILCVTAANVASAMPPIEDSRSSPAARPVEHLEEAAPSVSPQHDDGTLQRSGL